MMKHIKSLFLLIIILSFFAINVLNAEHAEFSYRSGTEDNDDIEEPLKDNVKQYEACLINSNKILDLIKQRNKEKIYTLYVSDNMKKEVSREKFDSILNSIEENAGKILSYKPMQWFFIVRSDEGFTGVACIKLVHCEKATVYYQFVFNNDDMTKLIGLGAKPK